MSQINQQHIDFVLASINQSPYFKHLSMKVTDMGIGHATVVMELTNQHLNPFGGVHGGAYASVLDTAAYWAVYCDVGADDGLITIDMKIDMLSAVSDGKLVVSGKRIKAGRTICLAESTIIDSNGKCCAHCTSKMIVTQGLQTMESAIQFGHGEVLPAKFIEAVND